MYGRPGYPDRMEGLRIELLNDAGAQLAHADYVDSRSLSSSKSKHFVLSQTEHTAVRVVWNEPVRDVRTCRISRIPGAKAIDDSENALSFNCVQVFARDQRLAHNIPESASESFKKQMRQLNGAMMPQKAGAPIKYGPSKEYRSRCDGDKPKYITFTRGKAISH